MKNKYHLIAVLAAAALTLEACTSRIAIRGNLPDPDLLANIEVGHVNKRDVGEMIGSPSSVAPFQGETWYYISERTETVAFLKPEVLERKVVIIRFDDKGIVKEKKSFGLEAGQDIEMVARVTPTAGNELSLIKQLFGNIGRFNNAGPK